MTTIAIVGGGPTSLLLFKRLLESGDNTISITIFEKSNQLGCGMPYGQRGAADEHITNVSGNEIPELAKPLGNWMKSVSKDTLDKYHLAAGRFNEYKVLPRLLFGQYLCDQYNQLLQVAKTGGFEVNVSYNTEVIDIVDQPETGKVGILTADRSYVFERVVICTGHFWPKHIEGKVPGWFDSPYPPEKIALKANSSVAIRGASLTGIDAIRTLARHNGRFEKDENGRLKFEVNPDSLNFRIVLHTRNGLLPAVRFHLEDTHLGKNTVLSSEEIKANMAENGGFLSLDYVFDENFKAGIREHDPECYRQIKDMTLEEFVSDRMKRRESKDPFDVLKDEYDEAERSISHHNSVYWKEQLAILSFAMNYPAKHFSAEDWLRLHQTLMPLISAVIAFVPQSSAETLMALHEAGRLSMIVVDTDAEPLPQEGGGATYAGVHYPLFIDCTGQPHIDFEKIPFKGLQKSGSPARLQFHDRNNGQLLSLNGDKRVIKDAGGNFYLTVPGLAINDHFQLLDSYNALNDRIYVMAVPFIGGYNPDYSGLDFGEAASEKVAAALLGTAIAKGKVH